MDGRNFKTIFEMNARRMEELQKGTFIILPFKYYYYYYFDKLNQKRWAEHEARKRL
jgi:hypothetical protein